MNALTFSSGLAVGCIVGAVVMLALTGAVVSVLARKYEINVSSLEEDLEKSQAENVILRMKVNDLERHQGVPFDA